MTKYSPAYDKKGGGKGGKEGGREGRRAGTYPIRPAKALDGGDEGPEVLSAPVLEPFLHQAFAFLLFLIEMEGGREGGRGEKGRREGWREGGREGTYQLFRSKVEAAVGRFLLQLPRHVFRSLA